MVKKKRKKIGGIGKKGEKVHLININAECRMQN